MAQAKIRIIPGRRSGITSPPCFTAVQTAAQTFKNGAPVTLASAGTIQAVTTSLAKSSVTYAPDTTTLGIALGSASATSAKTIGVMQICKGQQFVGNMIAVSASSAKASKLGLTVYLGKQASDTHWGWIAAAHSSAAATVIGKVVGFVDPASTVNGRVLVDVIAGGQFTPDET